MFDPEQWKVASLPLTANYLGCIFTPRVPQARNIKYIKNVYGKYNI